MAPASGRWASRTARRSRGTPRSRPSARAASARCLRDPDDPYVRTIVGGRATAPIVGGNLFTFVHLIGTPWDPVFDGAILMLEEVDEPPYVDGGPPASVAAGGQARRAGRGRGRRAVELRLAGGSPRSTPHTVDRGCPRAMPRAARGPHALQAPPRTRETSWRPSRLGCKQPWTPMRRRSPSTNPASSPRRRYVGNRLERSTEGGTMKKVHKGLVVAVSGFITMILAAGGAWAQSSTPTSSGSDAAAPTRPSSKARPMTCERSTRGRRSSRRSTRC